MVSGRLAGRVDADLAPGVPRTWNVDISGLVNENGIQDSIPISSRHFRRHAKILILRIGDWDTEQLTLNPLASSLKAQLSLLLPPSDVDVEYIRTPDELRGALSVHGGGLAGGRRRSSPWGYAVIVGHGRADSHPALRFGNDWHGPSAIANKITGLGPGQKSFWGGAVHFPLLRDRGTRLCSYVLQSAKYDMGRPWGDGSCLRGSSICSAPVLRAFSEGSNMAGCVPPCQKRVGGFLNLVQMLDGWRGEGLLVTCSADKGTTAPSATSGGGTMPLRRAVAIVTRTYLRGKIASVRSSTLRWTK